MFIDAITAARIDRAEAELSTAIAIAVGARARERAGVGPRRRRGGVRATRLADQQDDRGRLRGSQSQHNVMRQGFALAYVRAVLVRDAPAAGCQDIGRLPTWSNDPVDLPRAGTHRPPGRIIKILPCGHRILYKDARGWEQRIYRSHGRVENAV
ncbi:MAG TPA: hypothetical protein VGB85_19495 [Nannocystis sp.]|jgi:hypothetical protein